MKFQALMVTACGCTRWIEIDASPFCPPQEWKLPLLEDAERAAKIPADLTMVDAMKSTFLVRRFRLSHCDMKKETLTYKEVIDDRLRK